MKTKQVSRPSETLILCGNVLTKNKSVPLCSNATQHRNKNTTPNLQCEAILFYSPTA
jgi:hypothetical protein